MWPDLTLDPLLQGQMRIAKLKSAYNSLIIGPRGLQSETNQKEIMGWESSDVVRFDLGPVLQGQTRTAKHKSAYNLLIIGPRGLQCETNLVNIMGWESSDVIRFNFGPCFKVKQWFIGFGELCFRWIQSFIGSLMRISRYY